MSTATIRPNATIISRGAIQGGAASQHAAVSDDSDTTYVDETGSWFAFAGTTIGSAVMKSARVRCRLRAVGLLKQFSVSVVSLDPAYEFTDIGNIDTTIETLTFAYHAVNWTQEEIDNLQTQPLPDSGIEMYEQYIDLIFVDQPVVAVDAIPDPSSSSVNVTWGNTLDIDGDGQTHFEVKAFTDAQYDDAGFDPDTSTAHVSLGTIPSSSPSALVTGLTNGLYRIYVRVAQTVNGSQHWSEWDYEGFEVDIETAEITAIGGTTFDDEGYIAVDVARDTGSHDWDLIEVQRSDDEGTTWTDVRFATYVPVFDGWSVDDHEVPNGTEVIYRARATWIDVTGPVVGEWLESAGVTWSSEDQWMKAPNRPDLNMKIDQRVDLVPQERSIRQGVFHILNAPFPVITSDVMSGVSWSINIGTVDVDEMRQILALMEVSGEGLFIDLRPMSQIGPDQAGAMYVVPAKVSEVFLSSRVYLPGRVWVIPVNQVEAPGDPSAGR